MKIILCIQFFLIVLTSCASTPTVDKSEVFVNIKISVLPKESTVSFLSADIEYVEGQPIPSGAYDVLVTSDGYQPYQKKHFFGNDQDILVELEKEPLRVSGEIVWGEETVVNDFNMNHSLELYSADNFFITDEGYWWVIDDWASRSSAGEGCSNLSLGGLKWSLPSIRDLNYLTRYLVRKEQFSEDSIPGRLTLWISNPPKKWERYGKKYITHKVYSLKWAARKVINGIRLTLNENTEDSHIFTTTEDSHAVCYAPRTVYSLDDLVAKMEAESDEQQRTINLPSKPISPEYPTEKNLTKGEFETSADFSLRVSKEKQRVLNIRSEIDSRYTQEIQEWKQKVTQAKSIHQENIVKWESQKAKVKLQLISDGIGLLYGKPALENIKYDADKERFSMSLVSERKRINQFKGAPFVSTLSNALVGGPVREKYGKASLKGVYFLRNQVLFEIVAEERLSIPFRFNQEIYFIHNGIVYTPHRFVINTPTLEIKPGDTLYMGRKEFNIYRSRYYPSEYRFSLREGKRERMYFDSLNIDATVTNREYSSPFSNEYAFERDIQVPVKLEYAKQFKNLLLANDFSPTVEVYIKDNELSTFLVSELKDPEFLLLENEYEIAKNSSVELNAFLVKYPNSPLTSRAGDRLAQLLEDEKAERDRVAMVAKQERERKEKLEAERILAEQRYKNAKEKRERELRIAREEENRALLSLGDCRIGNTVFHRERWDTTTSSGNAFADLLFNASIKEEFIITFEAIVENFTGDKVKVTVNDYKIQQVKGGGFFDVETDRKNDIAEYSDKYIGKVQFYDSSRCQ